MSAIAGAAARAGRAGRGLVPTGQLLTPEVWARRHRGIVWLLWLHVLGVAVFALTRGTGLTHALAEVSPMAAVRPGRGASGARPAGPLGRACSA